MNHIGDRSGSCLSSVFCGVRGGKNTHTPSPLIFIKAITPHIATLRTSRLKLQAPHEHNAVLVLLSGIVQMTSPERSTISMFLFCFQSVVSIFTWSESSIGAPCEVALSILLVGRVA